MSGSAAASPRSGNILGIKLIDDMHLAISPMLLGSGENLFAGIDMPGLGYRCSEQVATPNATHVIIEGV
ncbi:hypothetical protein MES4922_210220 [Mesorhizobium ventifaucium]|uniref:Uncharacterized protein n=1 Tax=Mesorhizobium ventifaucium TaxID=666020 RepID=A0ABM9DRP0_9HYPH|nr:hypothetical protein MES4922_210220 [Mesorhizobium ventifaucium]